MREAKQFELLSLAVIFLVAVLMLFRWPLSPTSIDVYYHLLTAKNFQSINGWTGISYWEFAPWGRPHLYPPLLHIIILFLLKLKLPALFVARLLELLAFPGLLLTAYLFIKNTSTSRRGFWTVLVASSMYSFYLASVNLLASSLGLILGILSIYALWRRRFISSGILLSLCFYSHIGTGLFFGLSIGLLAVLDRNFRRLAFRCLWICFLLFLPFAMFIFNFRAYFDPGSVAEAFSPELHIFVYILAFLGIWRSLKNRPDRLYPAMLFSGLLLAGSGYAYRLLSGQAMLGVIFLAALSLDTGFESFKKRLKTKHAGIIYILCVFILQFLLSPAIRLKNNGLELLAAASTYSQISGSTVDLSRQNSIGIYSEKVFQPLFKIVRENSSERDIIVSNYEYIAGMVASFTNRATSTAMLSEVRPFKEQDPFKNARLVIWLKDPEDPAREPWQVISSLGLEKAGQTDEFFVYKNQKVSVKAPLQEPMLPFWLSAVFLSIALVVVFKDLRVN